MVAVRVAAEQDLDVGELEPELFDRLLNRRDVALVRAVDEDVALRRDDEERGEAFRADVVDVADDLVRRKLRRLIVAAADVALEERLLREGVPADRDRRARTAAAAGGRLPRGRRLRGSGRLNHRSRRETPHPIREPRHEPSVEKRPILRARGRSDVTQPFRAAPP